MMTLRAGDPDSGTKAGKVMGTAAYMPPEQAEGEIDRVDRRADVFALGSILCAILTGQPAYTGRSFEEVLRKARRGDVAEARGRLDASGADPALIALPGVPGPGAVGSARGCRRAGRSRGRLSVRRTRAAEGCGPGTGGGGSAGRRGAQTSTVAAWPGGVIAGPDSADGWNLGLCDAAAGSPAGSDDGLRRDGPDAGRPGPGPSHGIDGTWCRHPGLDRGAQRGSSRRRCRAQRRGDDCIEIAQWPRIAELESRLAEARQHRHRDSEAEQKLVQRLETIRGQRGQRYDPARSDAD